MIYVITVYVMLFVIFIDPGIFPESSAFFARSLPLPLVPIFQAQRHQINNNHTNDQKLLIQ